MSGQAKRSPDWRFVVRGARARAGQTQAEFAEAIGVTQHYLCMMEHGRRAPGAALMCAIAEASGERLSTLIAEAE